MKRAISGLTVIAVTFMLGIVATFLYPLFSVPAVKEPAFSVDYSLPPNNIYFDTSLSIPRDWQIIDDAKWGFKLHAPAALIDKGFEGKSLWVHESDKLRLVIDFGDRLSQKELSLKRNYAQTILRVNNLKALVCTYEEKSTVNTNHFNNVATLIFLGESERLSGIEPLFRVEYKDNNDLETALQILQTVSFYNP